MARAARPAPLLAPAGRRMGVPPAALPAPLCSVWAAQPTQRAPRCALAGPASPGGRAGAENDDVHLGLAARPAASPHKSVCALPGWRPAVWSPAGLLAFGAPPPSFARAWLVPDQGQASPGGPPTTVAEQTWRPAPAGQPWQTWRSCSRAAASRRSGRCAVARSLVDGRRRRRRRLRRSVDGPWQSRVVHHAPPAPLPTTAPRPAAGGDQDAA